MTDQELLVAENIILLNQFVEADNYDKTVETVNNLNLLLENLNIEIQSDFFTFTAPGKNYNYNNVSLKYALNNINLYKEESHLGEKIRIMIMLSRKASADGIEDSFYNPKSLFDFIKENINSLILSPFPVINSIIYYFNIEEAYNYRDELLVLIKEKESKK